MLDFFITLQEFINSQDIINIYYEEASKEASFPYGVISNPVETQLRYGTLIYFDINIWSSEPNTGIVLEEKVQKLIKLLNTKIFTKPRAVVYFETQKPVSDPEYELIKKQITFSARIY